jgi:type I restriction enzyme M protein
MPLPAGFEKQLWDAADQLWTNSQLQPAEYSTPVLALIFLKYADHRFADAQRRLAAARTRRRGAVGPEDYHAEGVVYLPDEARYAHLLALPEGTDVGAAINAAMKAIEAHNPDLKDVLPKTYGRFEATALKSLLKTFQTIPEDVEGDVFGRIYEYFLGNFAPKTLQKGGEFFTPVSVVRLIVEIIEPYQGRIYDPACGSGGMFVQSARFVGEHRKSTSGISIYGTEKTDQTRLLCRMNLAVHGLSGEIKEGNSYYDDPHKATGRFDFVMANPPFNQSAVDRSRIKDDRGRYPLGMPTADSANYLWIQLFYSALNEKGRAGFVMANSAADARGSELELRKKLIESGAVDVILTLSSNFFYTVTLPATLWFLDKGKAKGPRGDRVLFIDARQVFRQVDRAHRDFTEEQIEHLANVVRLFRGEPIENRHGGGDALKQSFPEGKYEDLPGLCKAATRAEIEKQGWSLNPGRYVDTPEAAQEGHDFKGRLAELSTSLMRLTAEARDLEEKVVNGVVALLGS